MRSRLTVLILVLLLLTAFAAPALADAPVSLTEVFDQIQLIPCQNFNGSYFSYGEAQIQEGYQIFNVSNRVLLPVRLMADMISSPANYWQVDWNEASPDLVQLTDGVNSVRIEVGQPFMTVNGDKVELDVAAQIMQNRTVLPLRAIGEALNKQVCYLDRTVIISDVPIAMDEAAKAVIADANRLLAPLSPQKQMDASATSAYLLATAGDTCYSCFYDYLDDGSVIPHLYRDKDGQRTEIAVPRSACFYSIKDEAGLYLTGGSGIYRLNFADNSIALVCDFAACTSWGPYDVWTEEDGWLQDVKTLGGDCFVVLHYGDNTMGAESIFRLEGKKLTYLASAKSVGSMTREADALYFSDFDYIGNAAGNLYKLDLAAGGEPQMIGSPSLIYDVKCEITEQWTSMTTDFAGDHLTVQDGKLYVRCCRDTDTDYCNLAVIDLKSGRQILLPQQIDDFWLTDGGVLCRLKADGSLALYDRAGRLVQAICDQATDLVKLKDGTLYYTLKAAPGLWQVNLKTYAARKTASLWLKDFGFGSGDTYLIGKYYDAGVYALKADGTTALLDRSIVDDYLAADSGVFYQKKADATLYFK